MFATLVEDGADADGEPCGGSDLLHRAPGPPMDRADEGEDLGEPGGEVVRRKRLVRAVPDGRSAVVEGAAHYPGTERPDACNALLIRILETHTG